MAKPRTHTEAARSRMVCIRLTEDEFARRKQEAGVAGMSMSGLCEALVTKGKVAISNGPTSQADPAMLAELKRIGSSLHHIAQAGPDILRPAVARVVDDMRDLIQLMMKDEVLSDKVRSLRSRIASNDSASARPRQEFQRSVQIHPARRGTSDG